MPLASSTEGPISQRTTLNFVPQQPQCTPGPSPIFGATSIMVIFLTSFSIGFSSMSSESQGDVFHPSQITKRPRSSSSPTVVSSSQEFVLPTSLASGVVGSQASSAPASTMGSSLATLSAPTSDIRPASSKPNSGTAQLSGNAPGPSQTLSSFVQSMSKGVSAV
jgi:hypothetical protein